MIRVENVTKIYGRQETVALRGVNLHISSGEIFGIIGLSGAGKSTLIRCLNLLERPTEGKVRIQGVDLTQLSGRELRRQRQKMGMIFQQFHLLSSRTVGENVAFPLEILGWKKEALDKRVREVLDLVELTDRADFYPAQLSGGQKQRVGIARALATDPQVLLCDEPTSALDPATTASLLRLLAEINQRLGLTIVIITHEMEVIRQICHRVAVLDQGVVQEIGEVKAIFADPQSAMTQKLLGQVKLRVNEEIVEAAGSGWIIKVTFIGPATKEPVISDLIQRFQISVNILAGNIEQVQGDSFGELIVEMKGSPAKIQSAIAELNRKNLAVEVIKDGDTLCATL